LAYAKLRGRLVELEPHQPDDADFLFPLVFERPAITDMLIWNGPASLELLREGYEDWRRGEPSTGFDYFFTIRALGGTPVGHTGVRFAGSPVDAPVGDIGYWLGEASWGKGFVTEAVRLLAWLSFEHLEAAALEAKCLAVNFGSQRVLEKAGFSRDASYAPEVCGHAPYGAEATPVCELRYELRRADWRPKSGLPVWSDVLLEGPR